MLQREPLCSPGAKCELPCGLPLQSAGRRGQALSEYVVLLALLAVGVLGIVVGMRAHVRSLYTAGSAQLQVAECPAAGSCISGGGSSGGGGGAAGGSSGGGAPSETSISPGARTGGAGDPGSDGGGSSPGSGGFGSGGQGPAGGGGGGGGGSPGRMKDPPVP